MSDYDNFPVDFVTRTKNNIDEGKVKYEVTNLINNCLGLIIIPNAKLSDQIPDYVFDDQNEDYGLTRANINKCCPTNGYPAFSLSCVLRHIRNGLSHGNIEQRPNDDGIIIGLRIFDHHPNQPPENTNFDMNCSIGDFKKFAYEISDKLISNRTTVAHQ